MNSMKRKATAKAFICALLLLSCRVAEARIRGGISIDRQLKDDGSDTEDDHRCAPIKVSDYDSCAAFCLERTGSDLNTLIVGDGDESSSNTTESVIPYCCACFSGDAYCSDDIPECTQYVNLDTGFKFNTSEDPTAPPSDSPSSSPSKEEDSCTEMNVTNTIACIDFCEEETGETGHKFESDENTNQYYCVCTGSSSGGGITSYCSDNMPDEWKAALSNSTILTLSLRLGQLP